MRSTNLTESQREYIDSIFNPDIPEPKLDDDALFPYFDENSEWCSFIPQEPLCHFCTRDKSYLMYIYLLLSFVTICIGIWQAMVMGTVITKFSCAFLLIVVCVIFGLCCLLDYFPAHWIQKWILGIIVFALFILFLISTASVYTYE